MSDKRSVGRPRVSDEPRDKIVTMRLTESEYYKLKMKADLYRITPSEMIRRIVNNYCDGVFY